MLKGFPNEDLSKIVKKVTFKLHDSFLNPLRIVESYPFQVSETGWGEFEIIIKVFFADANERVLTLHHFLKLYPAENASMFNGPFLLNENVVYMQYDEILFNEPTEIMHKLLKEESEDYAMSGEMQTAESNEIKTIESLNAKVLQEIEKYSNLNSQLEDELSSIKSLIGK